MSAAGLTKRQAEVLAFCEAFIRTRRVAPSLKEIARHFGFEHSAAHAHLNALEARGYVTRLKYKDRSLRIVDQRRCPHCDRDITNVPRKPSAERRAPPPSELRQPTREQLMGGR